MASQFYFLDAPLVIVWAPLMGAGGWGEKARRGGLAADDLGWESPPLRAARSRRVPELDRGEESGLRDQVCTNGHAGGRERQPGICRSPLLERMQAKQAAEDARRIRTIFAQHDAEY